jgi:hypothetical protein
MPIRVEHGPNLAPIGKLAYQTGQLEYRNKRRTELERLAMQQAEMRQRAQLQQRQLAQQALIQQGNWGMDQQRIAASFKQQKVQQQNAMGQLQQQQQWGVLNADVAHQQKLELAEGVRNHNEMMADRNGQNSIDRIKLTQGLADESEMNRIQFKGLTENFGLLSMEGQQFVTQKWQSIQSMKGDERVPEDQKQQREEQMMQEIYGAWKNPLYTGLGERGIGSKTSLVSDDDGNTLVNRVRTGPGPDDYRNEWATTYKTEVKDPNTGEIKVEEVPITKEMRLAAERSVVEIEGFKFLQEYDLETNKYSYTPLKDENNELTKKELMDGYQNYLDGIDQLAEDTTPLSFAAWKTGMGFGEEVPQDAMMNEIPGVIRERIDAATGGGIGGPGQMGGGVPDPGQMDHPSLMGGGGQLEQQEAFAGPPQAQAEPVQEELGPPPDGTQERPFVVTNMADAQDIQDAGRLQPGQWIELPPRNGQRGPKMQFKPGEAPAPAPAPAPVPVPDFNPEGMIMGYGAGDLSNPINNALRTGAKAPEQVPGQPPWWQGTSGP